MDEIGIYQDLKNEELEQVVIGALLIEREAREKVDGLLTADMFTDARNRAVFEAIEELKNSQADIDLITVAEALKKSRRIEQAGGYPYIALLASSVNSTGHVETHARMLIDLHVKRVAITVSSDLTKELLNPEKEDPRAIFDKAIEKLNNIVSRSENDTTKRLSEVLPMTLQRITEASSNGGGITGIPTGFQEVDRMICGLNAPDLIVIAGRPGMGKTAMALSILRNVSIELQIPSLIFTLEMDKQQISNRILVLQSMVENERVRTGNLKESEWNKITMALSQLDEAPLYIEDNSNITPYMIGSIARKYVRDKGVKVIVVDYLQLMSLPEIKRGRSRENEVATMSRAMKVLAKDLGVPIILLSQLNRSVETRSEKGKRPQLSDLRESGAIEQDADIVCFTHRPEYYGITEDSEHVDLRGKAEFIIAKQRNGRTGSVWLRFDAPTMRFYADSNSGYSRCPQAVNYIDEELPF